MFGVFRRRDTTVDASNSLALDEDVGVPNFAFVDETGILY